MTHHFALSLLSHTPNWASAVCGLAAGLMAARAWRVLRQGRSTDPTPQLAVLGRSAVA